MTPFIIFNIQITMVLFVLGLAAMWYVQPRLRAMDQNSALVVPLLFASLRVAGLMFLVPSLNVDMPAGFAVGAAYGDSAVAVLAFVAVLANRSKSVLGVPLAWAYAVLGAADLGFGFFQGFRYDMFSHLGGDWAPIVVMACLSIISLVSLFALLLSPNPARRISAA